MSTIFGDFMFKITAPVANAINNLKKWDSQSAKTTKQMEEQNKQQEQTFGKDAIKNLKIWQLAAAAAVIGFWHSVIKASPSIQAHLSLWGMYFQLFAMDIGERLSPAFELLTLGIDKLWIAWDSAPDWVKNIVAWGLGVISMLAGLTLAWFKIGVPILALFGEGGALAGVGTFIGGIFTAIGAAITGPVLIAIAIITAVIIAGYIAWKENFMGMKNVVALWWEGIKQMFEGLWQMLKGIWEMIAGLFTGDTDRFLAGAKMLWEGFLNFVTGWGKAFIGLWAAVGIAVIRLLKLLWDGAVWLIKAAVKLIYNIIKVYLKSWYKIFTWLWEKVWNIFEKMFPKTAEKIKVIFTLIKTIITEKLTSAANYIQTKFNSIIGFFSKLKTSATEKITDMWAAIKKVFTDAVAGAFNWGKDLITNLWNGIASMGSWIDDKVSGWIDKWIPIKFDIKANDKMAEKWGSDMVKHFSAGVNKGSSTIINQKIDSSLSINNSGSGGSSMDSYSLANMTDALLNRQFSKLKGLGSQYY